MNAPTNGSRTRVVLDTIFGTGLLAIAFYAGILTQKVNDLREAISQPGRVQISIEARTRLTALEASDVRQDVRLDRLEARP
jgi:hypothetical protein